MTGLPPLDFVEELRLRRWAIENYVSADQRDDLHPVIVDEMQRIDNQSAVASTLDVAEAEPPEPETCPPVNLVALAPETEMDDSAAELVAVESTECNVTSATKPEEADPVLAEPVQAIPRRERLFTSNIVPILPDVPMLHGPHEFTPPHMRTPAAERMEELYYT